MNSSNEIVEKFQRFQATGVGFDLAWEEIEPIVEELARRALRKSGVKVWTGYGEWAVDDVVSEAKGKLLELGQPGASGRFDPTKARATGLSGLKGWLWGIVFHEAVNWIRQEGKAGGKKLFLESDLELNDPCGDGEPESILKQVPAKIERVALLPVLEELIGRLPDPLMREAMLLKLHEELSEKATEKRLGVSDTTIHRRIQEAYAILRPQLEARGIDASWLAA